MAKGRGPILPDIATIVKAGINPKTGFPYKMDGIFRSETKDAIKKSLRIKDEQAALNTFKWYNLPSNITGQELERMLYYRGQLAFVYLKDLDEFYFMPYALDGGLDYYGRYRKIKVIPYNSSTESKSKLTAQEAYLSTLSFDVKYGAVLPEDLTEEDLYSSAVLLCDYSKQMAQQIIPRSQVNDPIIDIESECYAYMRTALLMGTGVRGVRVNDSDQSESVEEGARNMTHAALECEPYVPITGSIEFQELTNGSVTNAEDYQLAMQSIDNYRLSTHGIDNNGLYEKKSHMLESEMSMNGGTVGLVLQDRLTLRQNFCTIVNSIYGTSIWCEPSENLTGADINGDALLYDRNENGESTGIESEVESDE